MAAGFAEYFAPNWHIALAVSLHITAITYDVGDAAGRKCSTSTLFDSCEVSRATLRELAKGPSPFPPVP
jgi:hypothetical protein